MPVTSVTKDAAPLTLTVVGDFPVSQQRLWDAYTDPRQLERFWGPPTAPCTFTRHDFLVGGRAEYYLTGPAGEKWSGSWKFIAVNPIRLFEAEDGDNPEDENGPASGKFVFETTSTGSRVTIAMRFFNVNAMEHATGMAEGMRAAMPQLDALLTERSAA